MLRNDFSTTPSSVGLASTSSTRPSHSSADSVSAACLVLGPSKASSSIAISLPLVTESVSAERNAPFTIFLLMRWSCVRTSGPCTMPPPAHWGARVEPWRARPVPFWRHGLLLPPLTLPRVSVEAVPRRRAASSATTHSCTSGPLKGAPKTASSSATVWVPPSTGASGIDPDLHGRALRPGDRAPHEHQVAVGHQLDDGQAALRDALGAHLARHADALEDARRRRGRADRSRGAHVVRAVGLRAGVEAVALDRALEALAL